MKRILLPVVVILVLGVLGFVAWLGTRPSRLATTGPGANSGLSPTDAALATDKDRAGVELTAPDGAGVTADRAAAAVASAKKSGGGPVLKGEVRPPADCGPDEFVEVFGLAREADLDALQLALGPRRAGDEATGAESTTSLVLARAKLDAKGGFQLEFPAGTRKAHVILAGRSWMQRDSIQLDLRGADPRVVLQAECGGWVAARATLPAGASSRAGELEGQMAVLRTSLASMGGMGGMGRRGGGGGGMGGMFQRNERRALSHGGAFEIWALDPTVAYTLEFVPATFASLPVEIAELARGRATDVSVALTTGGSVTGRVADENGVGIVGAEIEARVTGVLFGLDDRTVRRATSGADGAYTLPAVAAGTVQVSARAKDHASAEARSVDVVDGAAVAGVDFALSSGETITGVVTWKDGKPAAGAEITAAAERGGGGGGPGGFDMRQMRNAMRRADDPKTIADAQGQFTLRGLAAGNYAVTAEQMTAAAAASHPDATNETKRKLSWRARRTAVATGTADLALVLAEPMSVTGVVTAQDGGAPVTEFNVRAQPSGGGGGRGGFNMGGGGPGGGGAQRVSEDVNDPRGEFVLSGLREGKYRVSVTADGFAASEAIEIEMPRKEDATPLAFALVRAATIHGVVRSPRGAPVAGATVASPTTGGGMFGRGGGGGAAADELPRVRTDGEGRFSMENLKAGRYALVAESKDWSRSDEISVELVAGQSLNDVALVMHEGGRVTGELYEEGRPAGGRTITALDMRTFTNSTARTDTAGRFVLEHLAPGTWTLTAMPSMSELSQNDPSAGDGGMRLFSRMKSTSVDVVEGQESHVVLGAAPNEPVAVRGKVTQGGAPVAGVRVTFLGEGQSFGPGMKTATTGDDGSYSIQIDRPGEYSISVQPNGGRMSMIEFVQTVPRASEVTIDLPLPTARISGRVKTPDGQPAAGVGVTVQPATPTVGGSMMGGGFSAVTTDEDGAFDVNSLRAGSYTVTVGAQAFGGFRGPGGPGGGGADAAYGRKVLADMELKEGEWRRDVDVRLEKAGAVVVEVVDERGEKVSGASIFARDASGRSVDRMSTVRTDASGRGRYAGLAPGSYTFSARKDGLATGESTKVELREGNSPEVRVTIAQGTTLIVTTVDANDQPLRAQVRVTDEGGRDVAGLMNMQDMMGRFTRAGPGTNEQKIGPLAPGKYKVQATTTDGRTMEKAVTLGGQTERRMTLSFAN